MITKKLLCLSLFLLLITNSFAQVEKKTDKAEIANIIKASFDEIWSGLDSKKIQKFYTKDFLLLENGDIWNNDSVANYLNQARLKPMPVRKNSIEIIECKITGQTAWIAYNNAAIFSIDDRIIRKASWLESASLVLTPNGWKLNVLHSTRTKNEIFNVDIKAGQNN